jgi:hypothetical protein
MLLYKQVLAVPGAMDQELPADCALSTGDDLYAAQDRAKLQGKHLHWGCPMCSKVRHTFIFKSYSSFNKCIVIIGSSRCVALTCFNRMHRL